MEETLQTAGSQSGTPACWTPWRSSGEPMGHTRHKDTMAKTAGSRPTRHTRAGGHPPRAHGTPTYRQARRDRVANIGIPCCLHLSLPLPFFVINSSKFAPSSPSKTPTLHFLSTQPHFLPSNLPLVASNFFLSFSLTYTLTLRFSSS